MDDERLRNRNNRPIQPPARQPGRVSNLTPLGSADDLVRQRQQEIARLQAAQQESTQPAEAQTPAPESAPPASSEPNIAHQPVVKPRPPEPEIQSQRQPQQPQQPQFQPPQSQNSFQNLPHNSPQPQFQPPQPQKPTNKGKNKTLVIIACLVGIIPLVVIAMVVSNMLGFTTFFSEAEIKDTADESTSVSANFEAIRNRTISCTIMPDYPAIDYVTFQDDEKAIIHEANADTIAEDSTTYEIISSDEDTTEIKLTYQQASGPITMAFTPDGMESIDDPAEREYVTITSFFTLDTTNFQTDGTIMVSVRSEDGDLSLAGMVCQASEEE